LVTCKIFLHLSFVSLSNKNPLIILSFYSIFSPNAIQSSSNTKSGTDRFFVDILDLGPGTGPRDTEIAFCSTCS
jgi:hypothetical protein